MDQPAVDPAVSQDASSFEGPEESSQTEEDCKKKAARPSGEKPPSKKAVKLRKNPDAPRRFKSAYMFFSIEENKRIRADMKTRGILKCTAPEVAKMVSAAWKAMTEDQRAPYHDQAARDKARYLFQMSQYKGPMKVLKTKRPQRKSSHLYPKQPSSIFFRYVQLHKPAIRAQHPGISVCDLARLVSAKWKALPQEERDEFANQGKEEYDNFKEEVKKYHNAVTEEEKQNDLIAEQKALEDGWLLADGTFNSAKLQKNQKKAAAAAKRPLPDAGSPTRKKKRPPHQSTGSSVAQLASAPRVSRKVSLPLRSKLQAESRSSQPNSLLSFLPKPPPQPQNGSTNAASLPIDPQAVLRRAAMASHTSAPPYTPTDVPLAQSIRASMPPQIPQRNLEPSGLPQKPVLPLTAYINVHYEGVKALFPDIDRQGIVQLVSVMWERTSAEERAYYYANYTYQTELYESSLRRRQLAGQQQQQDQLALLSAVAASKIKAPPSHVNSS